MAPPQDKGDVDAVVRVEFETGHRTDRHPGDPDFLAGFQPRRIDKCCVVSAFGSEPKVAEDHHQPRGHQQHRHREDADLDHHRAVRRQLRARHQKSSRSAKEPWNKNCSVDGASNCSSVNGSYGILALSVTRNGERKNDPPVCLVGMSGNPRQFGPPEALTCGRDSGYVYAGEPKTKLDDVNRPALRTPSK